MELRNGKHLLPASSNRKHPAPVPLNHVNRRKPRPFRLLDLPTELRLIVYGYTFGHEDIHWTMAFESTPKPGYILALGRVDAQNVVQRNANPLQNGHCLLRTCKKISQEAFPVFYDQTCFDIGFSPDKTLASPPEYRLEMTSGRFKLNDGLVRKVFWRINHVRFSFAHNPYFRAYIWEIHLLRSFLGHGAWLRSLEVVAAGSINFNQRGRPDFDRLETELFKK